MLTLYLLQAIVPLALIVWIAIAPQLNIVGYWTQAIATGIGIIALAHVGIWLFPPWWTPYAFGVCFLRQSLLACAATRS